MRIFAAGDIHGDMGLAERLAEKSSDADLVILCGDLAYADQSLDNIIGPFKKRNKKVLIIPGNHETIATADFLAEIYNIKNIHGYSVKYDNVGIFGSGGANIGVFQISEEDIFENLKKGFERIRYLEHKLMVTHVHPSGTKMEKFSHFVPGSTGVRKAIEELKPKFLLCSHVHEAEGIEEKVGETTVLNVGKEGKHIDL
ncbi:MAG: metallophosphoesterase [Candidatus Woesearchaeota archaeon]